MSPHERLFHPPVVDLFPAGEYRGELDLHSDADHVEEVDPESQGGAVAIRDVEQRWMVTLLLM